MSKLIGVPLYAVGLVGEQAVGCRRAGFGGAASYYGPMRVGVFGGTFDPVHKGHLLLAETAEEAYGLDRVLLAPTGRQPLKEAPPAASYADRLAMVRLAVEEEFGPASRFSASRFAVSEEDAPRPDRKPNYTVDLLRRLRTQLPGAELWVLAGADSFLTLRRWREPDALLALAEWVVVSRPGSDLTQTKLAALGLTAEERARVHLLMTLHEEVSATDLRRRLAEGDGCEELLPASVVRYIREHDLYRHPPRK